MGLATHQAPPPDDAGALVVGFGFGFGFGFVTGSGFVGAGGLGGFTIGVVVGVVGFTMGTVPGVTSS